MGKPRVILADTDENYLIPLELKFLEELGDEIELEIITDPDYFREQFSKPQNADILAVSQDLFEQPLLRQNISNLFLLGEMPDDELSRRLDIPYIYKYSSLKEIYGKIMAYSNDSISLKMRKGRENSMVLFCSAVGGVGKTTLALGLCTCLSQNFKRVLYINADHLNSFQFYLGTNQTIPISACRQIGVETSSIYQSLKNLIVREKFSWLPPFGAALSSLNLPYRFYEDFARGAKESGDYDVVVVDADVMFDSDKARLASSADKVFVITDQTHYSVFTTNLLMKNMNLNDSEKYYFICNKYQEDKADALEESSRKADFIMDEYVKLIPDSESLSLTNLGMNIDIQRLSFLVD